METNILLESGTNELEILEFKIGENHYGINVAKVREILQYQPITPVPNAHPYIEGLFMPRDAIITVVDLARSLSLKSTTSPTDMLIITNFNSLNIAFHVHQVLGIHRVSWADVNKPDRTVNSTENSAATGILKYEGRLIIILDFEKIVSDISPETTLKMSEIEKMGERERNDAKILVAEDSPLLSKLLEDSLHKAGYTSITMCNNGQEAWDKMVQWSHEDDSIYNHVRLIITDIEMPMMDGHRLCKLVREHKEFDEIPIIIFSSLINAEMRRKGESLGVDAQITKPEIGKLVGVMDELIQKTYNE
ncbi:MAG: chemotaxis protein [Lachnospiraceae bacterium]|nr:chemotaxis protein [Lachnospiraceae bacterium]